MGFSASNTGLWNPILQLGILSIILLFANLLRRKIKIIRISLLPTAVLGGFIALLLANLNIINIDTVFMENVTYHTIAIGFIALSLRIPNLAAKGLHKKDGLRSGALIVSTYLLQGIIGIIITTALAYTFMPDLFKASGILLPLGYGQGPGQANNIGMTYEHTFGFSGGATFGMALATMGFLWACIGGVLYMNILIKRKNFSPVNNKAKTQELTVGHFQDDDEIPMAESIDKLSVQAALVISVYLFTYLFSLTLTTGLSQIPALSNSVSTLNSLIWGFNFVIGSLFAILTRNFLFYLRKRKLMNRQYLNNYLLNRISGLIFDIMIIAGISTIRIGNLKGLWVPFILISMAGGIITIIYLAWICKRLYPDYYIEGFFSMYGMLTGTVSTGILLLREVDPNFTSPATNNLISGTSFAIVLGIPMLVLVGLAPQSNSMLLLTFAILIIYEVLLLGFMIKDKISRKAVH